MVKSLVIAVFAGSLSLTSLNCLGNPGSEQCHDIHSSHSNSDEFGAESDGYLWASMNALSPSSRRSNHWLVKYEAEEIIPVTPDELADLNSNAWAYKKTIHRIKRIEREKAVEAKESIEVSKVWYEQVRKEDAHLEIYISGGGFRGGINPIINDQIMISNSGLVQRMYETELEGRKETKLQVNRDELFELVKWIAESGFFEFDNEYECPDKDQVCWQRKDMNPAPLPLKLVVAMGPYRNVVSVPIFSPDRTNDYIPYPAGLRKIVKAIYDFASL